jgi:hypothetical protein
LEAPGKFKCRNNGIDYATTSRKENKEKERQWNLGSEYFSNIDGDNIVVFYRTSRTRRKRNLTSN